MCKCNTIGGTVTKKTTMMGKCRLFKGNNTKNLPVMVARGLFVCPQLLLITLQRSIILLSLLLSVSDVSNSKNRGSQVQD